jgi:hypothetical protein
MPYPFHCRRQRPGQLQTTAAVALEHLQGHALRRFLPDTGQDAQGIDQLADQRAEAHGDNLKIV